MLKTHAVLFMSQAPFGVYVVLARGALSTVSAVQLLLIRLYGGVIAMLAFQYLLCKKRPLHTLVFELSQSSQRSVIASGLMLSFGPLLFMMGLERTPAIVAAAIDASSPAVALVIGLVTGVDGFRVSNGICILLSMLGNALVLELWKFFEEPVSRREQASRWREGVGAVCVLLSVFCVVGNFYLQRPLLRVMAAEDMTTYTCVVGTIAVSMVAITELPGIFTVWGSSHTTLAWGMLAYAALLQGWSHNYFGSLAVKRSTPMLVSMYTSLIPGISAVLGYAWLSERVSGPQALGVLVVVTSVVLSAYFHEAEAKERDDPPTDEGVCGAATSATASSVGVAVPSTSSVGDAIPLTASLRVVTST